MNADDKAMLIRRLQHERASALEDLAVLADRLRRDAIEVAERKDVPFTPGNLSSLAAQVEVARQRASTSRLALELLGVFPD